MIARIESGRARNMTLKTIAKTFGALRYRVRISLEPMPAPSITKRPRLLIAAKRRSKAAG